MTRRPFALAAASLLTALPLTAPAAAQTDTTFTYQGRLEESGAPAGGAYDLAFSLWDAPSVGAQIGSPVIFDDLPVAGGLFSVELDFGADAFDGSPRWLEITVEGVTLSPRTPVTRSPYAVQTRGIFVDDQNHVGIGTTAPEHMLDVEADAASARITTSDNTPLSVSRLIFQRAVNAISIYTGLGAIDFVDLDDQTHASISAGSIAAGASSRLDVSVGVANASPQLTITPEQGVEFGPSGVKPAFAYIKILNGEIASASDNILSILHTTTGVYHISVEGGFEDTDITLATAATPGIATARVTGDVLIVNTYGFVVTHEHADRDFSVVVYRP